MNRDEAKEFVKGIIAKAANRYRQEVTGTNEELLKRVVRQHHSKISRISWKAAQKWCKWDDEGPVLMPDYTRIYYRRGKTEIIVQEFPPQVRLMKFKGSLAKRRDSEQSLNSEISHQIFHYSLALPYTVFIFKFVQGNFTQLRCAFNDRPLKRLEERPLRPYLSNIDSNLNVCLGHSLNREELIQNQLTQQIALILSNFWQTAYSDEWSGHFWEYRRYFGDDSRLATLEKWQEASVENPLFVVEDVEWMRYTEESFGNMIVRMLESDSQDHQFQQEMYDTVTEEFIEQFEKTLTENLTSIETKLSEEQIDQLTDELMAKL